MRPAPAPAGDPLLVSRFLPTRELSINHHNPAPHHECKNTRHRDSAPTPHTAERYAQAIDKLHNKNMLTISDLRNWFDDLWKIIFDINVSISNIKRMAFPIDDIEKKVLSRGFFSHFYRQSRFTIIVQLCKLLSYSDNQKRSIYKLLNRLSEEKFQSELTKKLLEIHPEYSLKTLRAGIRTVCQQVFDEIHEHNDLISKIVVLRDKYYAHSDPDVALPNVTNEELEKLVNLSISVYNRLYGLIFNSTFIFTHNNEWKVDYPLHILYEAKKKQIEDINQQIASA